jgi:hypothetical protein
MGRELDALLQHNDASSQRERFWLLAHVIGQVLDLDSDTLRLEGHDGSSHVSLPPTWAGGGGGSGTSLWTPHLRSTPPGPTAMWVLLFFCSWWGGRACGWRGKDKPSPFLAVLLAGFVPSSDNVGFGTTTIPPALPCSQPRVDKDHPEFDAHLRWLSTLGTRQLIDVLVNTELEHDSARAAAPHQRLAPTWVRAGTPQAWVWRWRRGGGLASPADVRTYPRHRRLRTLRSHAADVTDTADEW